MAKLASACLATLSAETVRVQLPSAPQQSPECGVDTDTDYWVGVSSHVIRRRRHATCHSTLFFCSGLIIQCQATERY